MKTDFEGNLIQCVKQKPCLYNKSVNGFHSRAQRDKAWAEVSTACDIPVLQCQCRWKSLRDRFVREFHKSEAAGNDSSSKDSALSWGFYKDLHFLREHIKPRSQSDLEMEVSSKPSKRSRIVECPKEEMLLDFDNEGEPFGEATEQSNMEFSAEDSISHIVNEEEISSEPSYSNLNQAQTKFIKVMGLIENVLKEKLEEKPSLPAEAKDPFYQYLESILNRVDETTRADVQLKLLNFANQEVKKAGSKTS